MEISRRPILKWQIRYLPKDSFLLRQILEDPAFVASSGLQMQVSSCRQPMHEEFSGLDRPEKKANCSMTATAWLGLSADRRAVDRNFVAKSMRQTVDTVPQDKLRDAAQSSPLALDAELACKVLEAAPTILYVYDVQKEQSVFQNRRIGDLLGHPPAQDLERTGWTSFIHPDDSLRFLEHRERLRKMRTGEMLSWEFRMRDGNGKWRWFLSRDSLLSN